jgi:anaerobic selenocysteine-containing dehydrogenase
MSEVDRRDFLRLVGGGGVGVGAGFMIAETIKHPVEYLVPYPVPPEEFSPGIATWYNSVCSMCAAGCGISVRTREGRAKKIEGNPAHPVNQGRLCALGQAGLQVLYNPDRLTGPLMRSGDRTGPLAQITWDEGLSAVADGLGGVDGSAIYLLTEGVRGHLAGLFELFAAGVNTNRLLHYDFDHPQALHTANKQFFGEDALPYYDLKNAQYVLSFGADFLGSWISPVHHGLGFGHSRQGSSHRGHFVQIEPRMSLSGAAADEWIPARPGTEGLLALGIAHHLVSEEVYEGDDRDDWVAALAPYSIPSVAEKTQVPADTIAHLAEMFGSNQPSLAIGGGAAGNHSNGVNTLVAVNALNYLAGNVGQAGGVLFNNAPMVGQAANPRRASYRSMVELADAAREGKIKVLIVNQTNPLFTMPAATEFKEALASIPLIVSLSTFMDETTAMADIILPSHTYLESWGDDIPDPGVGFSVASISQPVVSPLYDTRATGDIVLGLAHKLGLADAMPWTSMEDYLKQGWSEIYAQSGERQDFETFWRTILKAGVWGEKVRPAREAFALDKSVIENISVPDPEFSGSSGEFPFVLHPYASNTLHDGRGANLPWMQELPDPLTSVVYGSWVELNPKTAEELGFAEGDLVSVESPRGSITTPVYIYPGIRPDVVAMPIGQGHSDYGRYAKNRGSNPIAILAPRAQFRSGALASSATRVKLTATGRNVALVKTGGNSRQLGRGIVQTTGGAVGGEHSAKLNSIPITVEST